MKKKLLLGFFLFFSFPVIKSQIPTGFIGKYLLNNTATDISGNGYNGILTSTSATPNRVSSAGAATLFAAGTSSGAIPASLVAAMQNDFTIGFWFKTTMVGVTGAQWYNGNSLVDAEVGGVTNDWGISLIDGGKVCFGVGNPDITIKSTASNYNNNIWHFVTATRNRTSGTVILYMDGASPVSSTGINTGALTAPSVVGLGRSSASSTGTFTGSLDDMLIYNRVLTAAEVTSLYNAESGTTLPVKWMSFTGAIVNHKATLNWVVTNTTNSNYFEIAHSADNLNFTVKGTITADKGISSNNATSYVFNDLDMLADGPHFYRIKQIDNDGKYTFSNTINLKTGLSNTELYLNNNPVTNEVVIINPKMLKVQQIQVIDASGKIISSADLQTNDIIIKTAATQLVPGYYFLKIFSNTLKTIPFIKQ